jgi:hypothetical protein
MIDQIEFQNALNEHKKRLIAASGGRWNTDTAADYFVLVVEEYHKRIGDAFDANDLHGVFRFDANLNNSNNRLRKQGLVTEQSERGAGKLSGLL